MPAFSRAHGGNLARPQIQILVDQIKGVPEANGAAATWGSVEPAPSNVPPYLGAEHQAERTSDDFETIRTTLFARACANCHGDMAKEQKTSAPSTIPNFSRLRAINRCGASSSRGGAILGCRITNPRNTVRRISSR